MVSATPPLPWSSKRCLDLKHTDLLHSRWTLWVHKVTYPEHKRIEALGLPADDDCDPSDEQQQQHSHCSEHGVSREHMSGPLGQDQAQDDQQETPPVPGSRVKGEGQGGGEQAGPRRQMYQCLGSHPTPKLPTPGRDIISPRLFNFQNTHSHHLLSVSEYDQREIPLLTKQEGTSIDNLARFLGGDVAGREPQTL